MVKFEALKKVRGVPVILPFDVKDNPFGKLGEMLTLEIGPPLLMTITPSASFLTIVMVVVVEANASDGAISMTSKPTAKVWVVELVVALTV